jgi:hypothetical protein
MFINFNFLKFYKIEIIHILLNVNVFLSVLKTNFAQFITKSLVGRIAQGDIGLITHWDSTHFTTVNLYKILTN